MIAFHSKIMSIQWKAYANFELIFAKFAGFCKMAGFCQHRHICNVGFIVELFESKSRSKLWTSIQKLKQLDERLDEMCLIFAGACTFTVEKYFGIFWWTIRDFHSKCKSCHSTPGWFDLWSTSQDCMGMSVNQTRTYKHYLPSPYFLYSSIQGYNRIVIDAPLTKQWSSSLVT